MTRRSFRSFVVATLSLCLVVNQAESQESKSDPLEGIVVETSPSGEIIYQPEPIAWPVPDIFLSALMVRSGPGARKLILGVVLNGVDDDVLGPLAVSIDGATNSLKLNDHPRIDRSGCVPTAAQTINADDVLVRPISMAAKVQVAYKTPKVRLKTTLSQEDLERFRRIIALYDLIILPTTRQQPKDQPRTEGVSNPELILSSRVEPVYPPEAIAKGRGGQVVLAARILKDGTVGTLRPVRIPAQGCGFAEAAMEAVKKWKYRPAMKQGQPVEADFTIIVDFVLGKGPARVALSATAVAGRAGRGL